MSKYKIYPLLYCTTFSWAFGKVWGMAEGHGGDYGATHKIASLGYAVDDGDNRILVDTGPPDKKVLEEMDGRPWFDYSPVQEVLKSSVGWDFNEVNIVINTHLHFDHCSGNVFFSNAEHYIQREELRNAAAPIGSNKPWPIVRDPRFWELGLRLVNGDCQIVEGVTLISLPGHSPGHQGVMIDGKRRAIIAGDHIQFFENWEKRKPTIFTHNPENWYESMAKMEKARPDLVLPGHDLDAMKKNVYEV